MILESPTHLRELSNNFCTSFKLVKFTLHVISRRKFTHVSMCPSESVSNTYPTFSLCAPHFLQLSMWNSIRGAVEDNRYNQSILKYLQDKRRQFLSYCMNRISAAEEISPEEIREGKRKGEFHVASADSKDIWYDLSFGRDEKMPKCSCPDFS